MNWTRFFIPIRRFYTHSSTNDVHKPFRSFPPIQSSSERLPVLFRYFIRSGTGLPRHMHCIVSGPGLTRNHRIRRNSGKFFIPLHVLRDKFKGKFLALLDSLFHNSTLSFPASMACLGTDCGWQAFKDSFYKKDWCPYIKEMFKCFVNALVCWHVYIYRNNVSNIRHRMVL